MPDLRKARLDGGLSANERLVRLPAENYSCCFALGSARGSAMGKFFLIVIAVSVAILLAMSAYVISL
jgi:hypothetical protein